MAARPILALRPPRLGRRVWLVVPVVVMAAAVGASWRLTASLDDAAAPIPTPAPAPVAAHPDAPPEWPLGRLEGDEAKRLLLEVLVDVAARIDRVEGYTATLRKQERLRGALGPEQTLAMKVRHRPFAVYLKFLAPVEGKEIVYAEGHHDNKMIAHSTGVSRLLVPRLAVPPDHPIALAEARHPVTEAGLANLSRRLVEFRRKDLDDPEAVTILDRTAGPDGRSYLRSLHLHPRQAPDRPFARVEVLYDPETRFPIQITNFDWPRPEDKGDLPLAERYRYDDLDLDASLSALDFDPANPAYAFHRY
jgi:hypothetical protein